MYKSIMGCSEIKQISSPGHVSPHSMPLKQDQKMKFSVFCHNGNLAWEGKTKGNNDG